MLKTKIHLLKIKKCRLFSSYSYLDAHANKIVQKSAIQQAIEYSTGNHGPRMLLGNTSQIIALENKLAIFFNKDACIVSSNGYMACNSSSL
jgi:7-keto-8-aminopelargonate synthetase-like enzyme